MDLFGLESGLGQGIEESEQEIAGLIEGRGPIAGPRVKGFELALDFDADRPLELPGGLDLDPSLARMLDHPAQKPALTAGPWLARLQVMVDRRPAPARCAAEDASCAEIGAQAHITARAVELGRVCIGVVGE